MTRKQAEKHAAAIVAAARASQPANAQWTTTEIPLSDALRSALTTSAQLVWGCLPLGWAWKVFPPDAQTLTVTRKA